MAVRKTKKKKATRAKARKPAKAKKRVAKRAVKAKKKVVRKAAAKPKRVVKRTAKPKAAVKKEVKFKGKKVGKVTHYFGNIGVAVIELSETLKEGDNIKVKGATSDFDQAVSSMQIEHEKVDVAKKGQSIGLKVKKHAREHDTVYKI